MSDHLKHFERQIAEQARQKGIPEERALRRFRSFEEYTAEASDKLGLPPDADACRSYASIKISLDAVIEAQMLNRDVDPQNHLKLIEALQKLLPAEPVREHEVTIQLVERAVGIFNCQHCGKQNNVAPLELPPPIERVTRDVTPATPAPFVTDDTVKVVTPDMVTPPSRVPPAPKPLAYQPPEPTFSACTVVKGVSTSDRWTK
jgi:hypothetical protein